MNPSEMPGDLRRRAQGRLGESPRVAALPQTEEGLTRLVHELQVHQVELELQNEELCRAKNALEESSARYADLYDFAPVGYFTLDREGRLLGANLRGAGLLGLERPRLAGRRFGDFVAADARPAFATFLAGVFAGKRLATCEVPLAAGTRSPRHVRIEAALSPSGGECRLAVSDITELKRAEEERARLEGRLREAQKMEAIGALVGGIAHDFNNLLAPVVTRAEMALRTLGSEDPVRENIAQLLTAVLRAAELVRQILLIGGGEQEGTFVPVDLGPLVHEAAAGLRATLPATVEVRSEADPACGPVLGDPSRLRQVLRHLSENAGYALEETGGLLAISLDRAGGEQEGGRVRLRVRDTGPGIPGEIQGRIFEPYFTTKPVGKGSGLGLSVVYGIVSALGGEVRVRSGNGEGTTFEVLLPEAAERGVPLALVS
ncbi:MAG: ATP-binding protein [Deferrisomatales bacterium]|nr:ATP-binding protein [Deferrisomatales bacterium]